VAVVDPERESGEMRSFESKASACSHVGRGEGRGLPRGRWAEWDAEIDAAEGTGHEQTRPRGRNCGWILFEGA